MIGKSGKKQCQQKKKKREEKSGIINRKKKKIVLCDHLRSLMISDTDFFSDSFLELLLESLKPLNSLPARNMIGLLRTGSPMGGLRDREC